MKWNLMKWKDILIGAALAKQNNTKTITIGRARNALANWINIYSNGIQRADIEHKSCCVDREWRTDKNYGNGLIKFTPFVETFPY